MAVIATRTSMRCDSFLLRPSAIPTAHAHQLRAALPHHAAVRTSASNVASLRQLGVAGVEDAKTDLHLTLEFMGDARSKRLLKLAPSTSASCLALTFGTVV